MFKVKPFGFEGVDQCTALARYLLEAPDANMFTTKLQISKLSACAKEIGGKLFMELEEWEVFKPEDEKLFDKERSKKTKAEDEALFIHCACVHHSPQVRTYESIYT